MTARQFGRDTGDTYGRHALVNPGGDNVQRDVLRIVDLGELYARGFRIHPRAIDPAYVGAHRADDDDAHNFSTVLTDSEWLAQ